jgi:hypothetical protein
MTGDKMPLNAEQFPFTKPYGLAAGPLPSKGPTAEALKRAVSRLGLHDWEDFDQHYSKWLWDEVANLKIKWGLRKKSAPKDGSYGIEFCKELRTKRVPPGNPNSGEYAVDHYSRKLVQDEAGVIATNTDLAKVQFRITEFWNILIANKNKWHYSQHRPIDVTVNPAQGGWNDCSGAIIQAHRYAQDKTGVRVPDPSKWDYKGYGNTDWYLEAWPKVGSPFRVGDIGHFHSSRHVIQCIKPGNVDTAQWGSNGSEISPERLSSLRGYYRFPEEYMFTVRPALTQEELEST